MNPKTIGTVYRLSATLRFNTERGQSIAQLIENVLKENLEDYDIEKSLKDMVQREENDLDDTNLISLHFEKQYQLVFSKLDANMVFDYALKMYRPFLNSCDKEGDTALAMIIASHEIAKLGVQHLLKNAGIGKDQIEYGLDKREERYDLSFIKIPDDAYIKIWKEATTFDKSQITSLVIADWKNMLGDNPSIDELNDVDKAIDQMSFRQEDIQNGTSLHLAEKPILKLSDDRYVVLGFQYILRACSYRAERLLKNCKEYRDRKGENFEQLCLSLFDSKFGSYLNKNIKYGGGEIDGLLNLSASSWFIECSSHLMNSDSLFGNEVSIIEDLNNSVIKCQNQGLKDIKNSDHQPIIDYKPKDHKGIIIITEGHYPNIDLVTYRFFAKLPPQADLPCA